MYNEILFKIFTWFLFNIWLNTDEIGLNYWLEISWKQKESENRYEVFLKFLKVTYTVNC